MRNFVRLQIDKEGQKRGGGEKMSEKKQISIVVPCYNEEESVPIFYKAVCAVIRQMDRVAFEFLFVNDGSKDHTLQQIKKLAAQDERVKYLAYSRNFGKEVGIYAGLKYATGDYLAVMDVDLQDPPEMLLEMYEILQQGEYDCVATRRVNRKGEPPLRSIFARMFYKLINRISKAEIMDGARDFRLMTRQMADAVLSMGEYNRFSKGIFGWVGFQTKWLDYVNVERVAGKTKWNFWQLLLYSIDGIVAFSTVPLSIAAVMGLLFCGVALLMTIFVIVRTLLWGDPVSGWPSMICVILAVGGVQLFCMGIMGQYLAKTFMEVKKRPNYIIRKKYE